jgi:hypothetical protein
MVMALTINLLHFAAVGLKQARVIVFCHERDYSASMRNAGAHPCLKNAGRVIGLLSSPIKLESRYVQITVLGLFKTHQNKHKLCK